MIVFILWGKTLEKYFGTILYALYNLVLGILSNLLVIAIAYFKYACMPDIVSNGSLSILTDLKMVFSGGPRALWRC